MAKHNHKVGDIVKVYYDPIDKTKLEGGAKIVCLTYVEDYYKVIFINDPETEVGRFIY